MASTEVERPGAIEISTDQAPPVVVDESAQILTVEFAEVPSAAPATTEQVSKKATKQKNERSPEKKRPNANNHHHQQANQNNRRFRHDNDGRQRGRKRSYSFNGGGGKFGPPHKRWKRDLRDFIVPPTKFLLGGNICDPLNLNSLQDEEINRAMNAVTPQSSPLPTPKHRKEMIEVLIPPNICDPLSLTAPDDDPDYERRLISPKKKRVRHRRRKSSSAANAAAAAAATAATTSMEAPAKPANESVETTTEAQTSGTVEAVKQPEETTTPQEKKQQRRSGDGRGNHMRLRRSLDDKIVSPVIPQPGAWKGPPPIFNRNLSWDVPGRSRNRNRRQRNKNKNKNQAPNPPVFNEKHAKFRFGNYNRYYGYRNPEQAPDVRMKFLRKDMFYGKEVLDIGCNVGHVTLNIARNFGVKKMVGMDIDEKLLRAAKNNMKHYASCNPVDINEKFPACMPILYGPLEEHRPDGPDRHRFPHNVTFIQGNYVLDTDVLVDMEKPQFDVILCLSVTKWFHLNFGDDGLKRAFRRMHAQLRPGGKLILEAQPWLSYKSKKKLTEVIFKNYGSIQLFPEKFAEYLLSSEVGFTKCEVIGSPQNKARGFSRPIQVFTKAELPHNSPSETVPSTACGDAALPTETSVIRPEIVHPLVDADEWVYAAPMMAQEPDFYPEVADADEGFEEPVREISSPDVAEEEKTSRSQPASPDEEHPKDNHSASSTPSAAGTPEVAAEEQYSKNVDDHASQSQPTSPNEEHSKDDSFEGSSTSESSTPDKSAEELNAKPEDDNASGSQQTPPSEERPRDPPTSDVDAAVVVSDSVDISTESVGKQAAVEHVRQEECTEKRDESDSDECCEAKKPRLDDM